MAGWLAVLHLEQGRPVSAFRRASESYTLFQQLGRTFSAQWPYTAAAQALAVAGYAGRAAETLAEPPSQAQSATAQSGRSSVITTDFRGWGTGWPILYAAEASAEAAVLLRHAGGTRRAAAATGWRIGRSAKASGSA